MAEELFLKIEELLCKQDTEKLKFFTGTLGMDGEEIKISKGRRDLKSTIIKVLDGKLDKKEKTDEENCDIFKHMTEDLKFFSRDYETTQADQKENGKKTASGDDRNADNVV